MHLEKTQVEKLRNKLWEKLYNKVTQLDTIYKVKVDWYKHTKHKRMLMAPHVR